MEPLDGLNGMGFRMGKKEEDKPREALDACLDRPAKNSKRNARIR